MLDLRRLATLQVVVERQSFSTAAAALDYTQSSVSQQIATLEAEVGITLIDRSSRPIKPTAIGEWVLARAEPLLSQADSIERELHALTQGQAGTLRVGGFFTAWATFMPGAVADFSRLHPSVQLEIQQVEPGPALHRLRAGDLDLAVGYWFGRPDMDDDRLAWTHLLDDPYEAALPRGHPVASAERVRLSDLKNERWVSPPAHEEYTQVLRRVCLEHGGFEPDVAYETADVAMAQPLVAAELAVALLPALGLMPRHQGVVARPLHAAPPARSVWAVRSSDRRAPTATAMIDALLRAVGELEASERV